MAHKIQSLNPYRYNKPGFFSKMKNFFFSKQEESKVKPISYTGNMGNINSPSRTLGIKKEDTSLSFSTLKKIADYDSIISLCVRIIKREVSQMKWSIVKKEEVDKIDKTQKEKAYKLFDFENSEGENLRLLLDRVGDDILTLDAGAIELIPNAKGEIVSLNSVDGSTIIPNINKYGEFGEIAYFQKIDDKIVAEFKKNELLYIMANPQNDVKKFGYGRSVIEDIMLTIQASLNADVHNATIFDEDNIPPGFINLGDVTEEEAETIKSMWEASPSLHKLRFLYGTDKVEFVRFNQNNRDMQFVEYIDWLTRVKLAAYGLTALDANILHDINKATAYVENKISKARGVRNFKHLIEETFNDKIFKLNGWDTIEFKFFDAQTLEEKRQQAEIDKLYVDMGVLTENDIRIREGYPPIENRYMEEDLKETPEEREARRATTPDSPKEREVEDYEHFEVDKQVKYPPLY